MTTRRQPPPAGRRTPPPRTPARGAAPRATRGTTPPRATARGAAPRTAPQRATARGAAPRTTGRPARPPVRTRPVRPRRPPRSLRLGRVDGRLKVGFAAVCTLLLVIGGRLVQIQAFDHQDYDAAADAQRTHTITLHALRGTIVDRNGVALAYTSNAQDITADPTQILAPARAATAAKLARLLRTTPAAILTALNVKGHYARLASALSPVVAQQVEDLHLPGIYTMSTTQRQYPGGTTAANIVGTVRSVDGVGLAGIENALNTVLAGRDGSRTYTVDNIGNVNPSSITTTTPARNGATVTLTIDQNLQYLAQQYLDTAVRESGARGATMAILDAHNGQVLTLAQSDTFDARDPKSLTTTWAQNAPLTTPFEPGSVQKSITLAAALQEKLITPGTVFKVPDSILRGGVTVRDAWPHSTQRFTATGILAESSNVGTLKIADKLGPEIWYRYEKAFGVGEPTGIELRGESRGYVPPIKDWSASTFANLPFGQGESMTILQLASIYQTIANGGVRIPPRIVQSVKAADGKVTTTKQPAGIRVIDAATAATLRVMLESVTLPGGTGVKAAVPGYRVAGKTGTAQQPDPNHGGRYSDYLNWTTFAGMAPADDPQFVVAIMVDAPAHKVEGGDVAAPLFRHIASYLLAHGQIPPTGSLSKHVPLQDCKGTNPAYLPANVC